MKSSITLSGYTLIEVMISTLIILGIVGGGVAAYGSFNERQTLVNAGRQLAVDLRGLQKSAQSGEKPNEVECDSVSTLDGWEIVLESNNKTQYTTRARCGGVVVEGSMQTHLLPSGVKIQNDPFIVLFEVLTGKASSSQLINLTNNSETYSIQITLAGGIKEEK